VPLEPEEPEEELTPEQLDRFIRELEEKMRDAAKKFEFEKAAELRDKIKALKAKIICDPAKVVETGG
jgi:excinuclease ABC subunit B